MDTLEPDSAPSATATGPRKPRTIWQCLGPGLVTGASDDDPSGIATYSQAGAQFGYGLAWTLVLTYPLMAAIQEISARIGRVTGHGIAGNLRRHYPPLTINAIVFLLVAANVVNIGADLGAMAAALGLLIGGPQWLYVIAFGGASAALQILVPYCRYVSILKWLTLSLFAYVATVLVVPIPWGELGRAIVRPHVAWASPDYLVAVVAVFGTTISPYLFFWQADQEVEEEKDDPAAQPLKKAPEQGPEELRRIRLDTYIGMLLSNGVALFIIITTAATLHTHGVTDIQTSSQAAEALRPIAGTFAFAIFALGIIGTGLLALPVLAGSAAYALGEARRWPVGLARPWNKAKAFYGAILAAMAVGSVMNVIDMDPVKALFWSAVVNGLVAVPVIVMMMRMATKREIMGDFVLPPGLRALGWACMAAMAVVDTAMVVTWFV
ncbi:NRAMP family divalent metal transporter [Nitrospirillum pindoramense]|uniref:NRAMP (Natural resistance-associated macrophage protein)-like metal ion transporter n=1 Tax=Nitrospirillum amazonense TaxID=28077 RepID=A0A560HA30_9PROT|nr:divalent metal cation transporter [Nitrospirillum amazonense]TWB42474.1 NRAMP (natural resistance-associated macrophage protein)-like metal ion transporter [Nitrospirillum amazonense]